jgi:homogentisate phytyltransferase / homogentisate geranylgeranyltransferase
MTKSIASDQSHLNSPELGVAAPLNLIQNPISWLYAFWKFSRPHTIVGTSLSVIGLFAIAWATLYPLGSMQPGTLLVWRAMSAMVLTWLACLCGNVYIVGLNQLEDIDIDRINKPHLPLASGEFLPSQGWFLVGLTGGSAVLLALLSRSPYLVATIGLSLLIGTAYSLPPIRLKRFPFWASFCILAVRGAVVNLGIFLHAMHQLGSEPMLPAKIWALALFVLVFSVAIAIFKDIPDIEGDRQYNISTFTVALGQRKVFQIARWIMTSCYGGMILAAPFLPGVNHGLMVASHTLAIAYFWYLSYKVNLEADHQTQRISYPAFYQFIWKLFFLEYLLFPLACWLA